MARPPRAEEASTRHVGFRLTEEEIEHLDELVTEHGFADRSALLRAWLEQDGPSKKKTRESSQATPAPNPASTSRTSKRGKTVSRVEVHPRTNYRQTPRTEPISTQITTTLRTMDSSPSPTTQPRSIMRELLAELHRQTPPRIGLIRVADVTRAMLAHASLDAVHEALLTLAKHGTIELRPDGGTEFLKAEDAALCPRGPRDTVFSYARWTDPR